MTHMSDVTNGASLEDSHTNFFALADLNQSNGMNQSNGINWRRLCADSILCFDPLEDPVLLSYSKCLSAGILCVWRRVVSQKPHYHYQNYLGDSNRYSHSKELWIFWYGEEPDLTGLVGPNLREAEQGSWESGLSYECRILLFKALHNLIEKCLLSKGFTRLGRFFVEPQNLSRVGASRSQIAFAFSFFVHGESTVCTSVDMRVAPSVYHLKKCHLQAACAGDHNVKVILSPYGLQGTLTGQVYRQNDIAISKMLSEWYDFYPRPMKRSSNESDMPIAVEVIVGGVRMKYPTSYVYVVEPNPCNNSLLNKFVNPSPNYSSSSASGCKPCPSLSILTPPTSPDRSANNRSKIARNKRAASWDRTVDYANDKNMPTSSVVKFSVSEEVTVSHHSEGSDSTSIWDFQDPGAIIKCTCPKKCSTSSLDSQHSSSDPFCSSRFTKSVKNQSVSRFTPFHKRTSDAILDLSSTSSSTNPVFTNSQIKGCSTTSGLVSLPQLHTPLTQPSSVDPSVDTSCYQVCSSDPIMPTLSPHPKTEPHVTFTHSPNADIGPTINIKEENMPNEILSSFPVSILAYLENAKSPDSPDKVPKSENASVTLNGNSVKTGINGERSQGLKRPILPVNSHDDSYADELVMSGLLYDYSSIGQFNCERPTRKRRLNSSESVLECKTEEIFEVLDSNDSSSPYGMESSFTPKDPYEFIDVDEGTPSEGFRQHLDIRIKEEERTDTPIIALSPGEVIVVEGPVQENLQNVGTDIKPIIIPSPTRNNQPKFSREEDLAVSVHDLDNIFDTSSSDNDDMFAAPISASKTSGNGEDTHFKSKNANSSTGLLELSRMYPTPPSLEQNAAQSPVGLNGTSDRAAFEDTTKDQELSDILSNFLSADVKDPSFVWKPTEHQKMLESGRYSPLNGISCTTAVSSEYVYRPSVKRITSTVSLGLRYCDSRLAEQPIDYNPQARFVMDDEQIYYSGYSLDRRFGQMDSDLRSPASNLPYMNKHLNSVGDSSMLPPVPEAHGLFVNLLLSDSMLNLFKDHNFDSCALCVCNMNIKGGDVGVNLPSSLMPFGNDEPQYRCTCGFSAVVYRHRSYYAGLFYEDEFDITGFRMNDIVLSKYAGNSFPEPKKETVNGVPSALIDLIKVQCKSLCSSFSIFQKPNLQLCANTSPQVNALEIRDGCETCFLALEVGKNMTDNIVNSKLDESLKPTCLHWWPYSNNLLPLTNQEIMLHLDSLKPILQEAIHKRNTQRLWEVTYVVEGPLTWREFHRLAARGTEDQCEPQPIPSVAVGYDKDYLSLSPFALKYWDKLFLEPYSLSRDVAYIVVAPENEYILSHVTSFFRELSSVYELLRMGRHCPIDVALRDGILRVGTKSAMQLADEPIDEWFNQIGDNPIFNKLRLYAKEFRHHLVPYLCLLEKKVIEDTLKLEKSSNITSSQGPSGTDQTSKMADSTTDSCADSTTTSHGTPSGSCSTAEVEGEDQHCPPIVIYIVEPFSFASVDRDIYRTVTQGLLLCCSQLLENVPEFIKNAVSLQLISLDSLLCMDKNSNDTKRQNELKSLAFSVFSQCCRLLSSRHLAVKSLTGFGPAAAQDMFLRDIKKMHAPMKVFNQPLVLAPQKDKQTVLGEMFGEGQENSGILYCSYCLTEDKRWLLASCTNDNGEIMETTIINIATPNRSQRKCASVRRYSLTKLLDFILEVLSNSVQPWRIIIGRLGRLGHGELRDWAALLSRKSLLSYSRHLRDLCKQCSGLGPGDMPSILSACLVSLEPDTALRIMPDQYTPDINDSNNSCNTCHLSTPEDASCTHILVFPTSATMQSSQATSHQEHIDPLPGGLGDDIFEALNDDDISVSQDINDIFRWSESPAGCQNSSPHLDNMSHVNSPNANAFNSPFHTEGPSRSLYATADCLDEPLQLLQQPLALGYYVSTAKTGHLPNWFWSSCPHLANRLPVFLKFALLIHLPSIQQNSDDILHANAPPQNCHPLDSNYTTDVLRYVLEGHNALSWLSLDPSCPDRRSCLPIHIQLLMQLYRIVENVL